MYFPRLLVILRVGWVRLFTSLIARTKPKLMGPGLVMSALIETTLVTDDFARVKGRTSPTGGFSCTTVETLSTQVLRLLGGSIICMHNWDGAKVRVEIARRRSTRDTRNR